MDNDNNDSKCIADKEIAHIVYASDDKFAEIMGVSIISLFENSKNLREIVIYILDSGISSENKSKVERICKQYRRHSPVWIRAKNISNELKINVSIDRGSVSQYERLFISSLLPKELDKVIYLDCDIIINKSISELWNLDLQGKTIAALMDAFSKYYRRNIGLQPNDIMFNSGVMLIDLVKWKEQKIEERLLKFICDRKGKIQQGDQGALNAVLSKDTYCFEPRFNSVTIFFDFNYREILIYRKSPNFYKEEMIKQAVEDPSIIHYTTSFISRRPWVKGCQHRYVNEWLKYRAVSPWKDTPLWDFKQSVISKLGITIYSIMPKYLSVRIAGICQAYGRPIKNKFLL